MPPILSRRSLLAGGAGLLALAPGLSRAEAGVTLRAAKYKGREDNLLRAAGQLDTPYTLSVKFAIAYDASGIAVCLNGGTVQTDVAVVPTLTGLQLGNRNTTKNRQLDGNVKKFSYYVTKLSNASLQALTT